ncbi:type VI secretion system baseplate subunit TssE [Citreicella sp. C3M06]|uniref:type VI secretion system baseplate subunit TssE n=1 Tax=Citreicella sp. C3M06 TaxID=2841564 RepID=UPI001C0A6639|nr:type VI secretion system baseplate subunit TssE [Citreicella sp. C3M06]MBU2961466.1 type VI secretion system baseplate subunit TssE [Citreicella sp. C3M06]
MSDDRLTQAVSRQDAVQPSLWDRLVDDLPGLSAEAAALGRDLARAMGAPEAAETLMAAGPRGIEARDDIAPETRQLAHRLLALRARKRRLEEAGIVVTSDILREAVRRDIEMLFNTERMEADFLLTPREALAHQSPRDLLADYPEVRRSVLNYGVPSFSGRNGADIDADALARELKRVLNTFEPRLAPGSVKVTVSRSDKAGLVIAVDGTLLLSPVPERLRLSTSIDLDNGNARTTLEER